MSEVTKPIALDESFKSTEQTPRNIADVLAEELRGIADSITTAESVEDILTDMATTKDAQVISGTAVFDTVDGNLVKTLKVAITPSQAGSGTPSPSNIRPISGHTEEVISVKDSTDTTQETYTTPFNQTVYGGTLDVLTGELTIDRTIRTLNGSEAYDTNNRNGYTLYNVLHVAGTSVQTECNEFDFVDFDGGLIGITLGINNRHLYFVNINGNISGVSDVATWKTWLSNNPCQITVPLATPTTISLTPQTVKSLVGESHIMASTGEVLECKFSMLINGDDLEMLLS